MNWWDTFIKYITANPFRIVQNPASVMDNAQKDINELVGYASEPIKVQNMLEGAEEDPTKTLSDIAKAGYSLTPEQEKMLDTLIAQQNVANDNAFQEHMRDTAYTSAGSQLEALGLSPSGVLQTGGASSGVSSTPATSIKTNVALERYEQRMALAKQLLSMTSSMASAGIYGNALGAAKKASGILTSSASNSALSALAWFEKKPKAIDRAELLRQLKDGDIPSNASEGLPF